MPLDEGFFYPVVGETWDGTMNDTEGFHVKEEHVLEALEGARGGFIPEGNVGGGTGMLCHGFKGGTGTASRVLSEEDGGYSNSSGDIFIAFSTANENAYTHTKTTVEILGDERMDPLYKAVADATEEAILNALCAAETMTGKKGDTYFAMPGEQVAEMVKASEKLWKSLKKGD